MFYGYACIYLCVGECILGLCGNFKSLFFGYLLLHYLEKMCESDWPQTEKTNVLVSPHLFFLFPFHHLSLCLLFAPCISRRRIQHRPSLQFILHSHKTRIWIRYATGLPPRCPLLEFALCTCHVHLRSCRSAGPSIHLIQNGLVNCSSRRNSKGKDIGDAIERVCKRV